MSGDRTPGVPLRQPVLAGLSPFFVSSFADFREPSSSDVGGRRLVGRALQDLALAADRLDGAGVQERLGSVS